MLVLFDIDATLLKTSRAGLYAMVDAARDLVGRDFSFEGVSFAGGLDPIIIDQILSLNAFEADADFLRRFRLRYRERLSERLAVPGTGRLMAGVPALLDALEACEEVTLGLLTGNFRETGEDKIQACGLDPRRFSVGAFADDAHPERPHRRDLVPVAIRRFEDARSRDLASDQVVVIGDTPHDVDCANFNGCRSLGVATGLHDLDTLTTAGADLAVADLSATPEIVGWIRGGGSSAPAPEAPKRPSA